MNFIDNLRDFDEDYIEIDTKEGYDIHKLKELLFKYFVQNQLKQRINLKQFKKKELNNKCVKDLNKPNHIISN